MSTHPWARHGLPKVLRRSSVYEIRGLLGKRVGQSRDLHWRLQEHYREGVPEVLFPLEVRIAKESHPVRRRRLERRRGGR